MNMKLSFKPKNNYYKDYSLTTAMLAIYLFTVLIAACLIIPNQEEGSFFTGVLKAIIWPLYSLFSILG